MVRVEFCRSTVAAPPPESGALYFVGHPRLAFAFLGRNVAVEFAHAHEAPTARLERNQLAVLDECVDMPSTDIQGMRRAINSNSELWCMSGYVHAPSVERMRCKSPKGCRHRYGDAGIQGVDTGVSLCGCL